MNPFQPLYDNCNFGPAEQKYAELPDFPRIIDVELTSSCNFRCLMCPTGNLSLQRKAEFMDLVTALKICGEAWQHGAALRFIGWGEPTLHPDLISIIDKCNQFNVLTHLNTNGSKIDGAYARKLVDAGLSSIKFSFQGVSRETYAEMRNTDFYDGMLGAIVAMREARGSSPLPFLSASTTLTYESPALVAKFKKKLEPLVDQLSIGHTVFDFMDIKAVRLPHKQKQMLWHLKGLASRDKRHPNPCPEVYDKLSVHANGDVVVCCNSYDGTATLGNVMDAPLKELWKHPTIEAYRKRLAKGIYSGPLCSNCYDYMSVTSELPDEKAFA